MLPSDENLIKMAQNVLDADEAFMTIPVEERAEMGVSLAEIVLAYFNVE